MVRFAGTISKVSCVDKSCFEMIVRYESLGMGFSSLFQAVIFSHTLSVRNSVLG